MSKDFLMSMNQLVSACGRPLNKETAQHQYAYYLDCAHDAGNDLPDSATIGKFATVEFALDDASVNVRVNVLNESFGLMPEYGAGNLVGDIDIAANEVLVDSEGLEVNRKSLDLGFCLYASGLVELSYAELDTDKPEIRDLYVRAGADPIKLKPQEGRRLEPGRQHLPEELCYKDQNRALNPEQLVKLNNFILTSFCKLQ
jgi:hypothetical protein